ncbi:hypothetical protein ACFY2Z_24820 [Streptomyces sp. NPDC001222]|uniref:hypothetical protein n=1 Tax=Streptomyces sp. NPDC001222 TaxID=3364548 RepID=UPI0036D0DBC1
MTTEQTEDGEPFVATRDEPADGAHRMGLKEAVAEGMALGLKWTRFFLPLPYADQLTDGLLKRFGPAGAPLEVRAQQVSEALADAAELLDELQAEVKLRSVIIQKLAEQTADAERRSEDAVRRAALDEEEAKAVDAYLDRALRTRLEELERNARRREIVLGTVVALVVGVASILVSHYLLGF